jgi:hypothetical protein
VCVKNANGALPFSAPFVCFAGDVDVRDSRFGALFGCSRARNRAICASLRFFSATRASLSFLVSTSLRRSVNRASGVSFESLEGGSRFWLCLVSEHVHLVIALSCALVHGFGLKRQCTVFNSPRSGLISPSSPIPPPLSANTEHSSRSKSLSDRNSYPLHFP